MEAGIRKPFFQLIALLALAAAAVGVALPGLPTVPFLLLAAWAGSKAWPRLEQWLLAHPRAGPPIRRWRERGAIPLGAKWAASAMMALSLAVSWWATESALAVLALALLLVAVLSWLWTRPAA